MAIAPPAAGQTDPFFPLLGVVYSLEADQGPPGSQPMAPPVAWRPGDHPTKSQAEIPEFTELGSFPLGFCSPVDWPFQTFSS